MARSTHRLLAVIPDRLSDLVRKGEVTPRYFNPGNIFGEVHVLMTNDDQPEGAAVKPMVGDAELVLHNLALPRWATRSASWRPRLLRRWAQGASELARDIAPSVVRAVGFELNAFVAVEMGRSLGVPVAVSLHSLPDPWGFPEGATFRSRFNLFARTNFEREVARGADLVIAVYRSILPYASHLGAHRVELAYNVVGSTDMPVKQDYRVGEMLSVVSSGRQLRGKDPTPLLEAVAVVPDVRLTLIGDGPLHNDLKSRARELGVADRVDFIAALDNKRLCASLADYDLFAAVNMYRGVPKTFLEAFLAGLPVLTNRLPDRDIPEMTDPVCVRVDPSSGGFAEALRALCASQGHRETIGRAGRAMAAELWDTTRTERRYADIYRSLLESDGGSVHA